MQEVENGLVQFHGFFTSKLLMFDLQACFPNALLFSLLDLDFSFLLFSNGHPLYNINPLVACRSRSS